MNKEQELAYLRAPSTDPKQRMIDYWGRRAEKAEDENERLRAALEKIAEKDKHSVGWVNDEKGTSGFSHWAYGTCGRIAIDVLATEQKGSGK